MNIPQNPSLKSSRYDFYKSAARKEAQRIQADFYELNNKEALEKYESLLNNQAIIREDKQRSFNSQRPQLIKDYTRDALDRGHKETHPALKLRHAPQQSYAERKKHATVDATWRVNELERMKFEQLEEGFLKGQRDLYSDELSRLQSERGSFNLSAAKGGLFRNSDRHQDGGMSL